MPVDGSRSVTKLEFEFGSETQDLLTGVGSSTQVGGRKQHPSNTENTGAESGKPPP